MSAHTPIVATKPSRYVGWTKEQEQALRDHYPTKGAAFVAELLGREINTVRSHAGRLGVKNLVSTRGGVPYIRHEKAPGSVKAPARGPGYSDTAPDTSKAVKTVYATPMPRFHVPDSFKGPFGLCEPGRDPMTGRAWSGSRKG